MEDEEPINLRTVRALTKGCADMWSPSDMFEHIEKHFEEQAAKGVSVVRVSVVAQWTDKATGDVTCKRWSCGEGSDDDFAGLLFVAAVRTATE